MKTPPKHLPAEEDTQLWNELTSNIKKIKAPNKDLSLESDKNTLAPCGRGRVAANLFASCNSGEGYRPTTNTIKDGSKDLLNNSASIDRNTLKRFRNYEFPIDAELDLHGHTEDQAYNAVFKFIKTSYSQGKRCLIIITGKGLHKSEDDYIFTKKNIKDQAPIWLNSAELSPYILTFTHPKPSLGGTGALYILLKRNKSQPL